MELEELEKGKCYRVLDVMIIKITEVNILPYHIPRCDVLNINTGSYIESTIVFKENLQIAEPISEELYCKAVKLHHTAMAAINALVSNNKSI